MYSSKQCRVKLRVEWGIRNSYKTICGLYKFDNCVSLHLQNSIKRPQKFISFLDRLIIFILHNYGLFPNPENTKYYWILSYIYHFFFSFLFCCGAMIYAILNISDAKKSTDALSTTLVILAFILKMINYHYYRKRILAFVSNLYELQVFESPDEIELSQKNK